jgi:hypothetical protein
MAKGTQEFRKSSRERKREIVALRDASSRLSEENLPLRQALAASHKLQAKSDRGEKQEISRLRKQQDGIRAKLARSAEELAKIGQEQMKSSRAREGVDRDLGEKPANSNERLAGCEKAHKALRPPIAHELTKLRKERAAEIAVFGRHLDEEIMAEGKALDGLRTSFVQGLVEARRVLT